MFEKVNPKHPDKIADRIAGALVDLAYTKADNPRIAAEVLIGHGKCRIIVETSEDISETETAAIVERIAGPGLDLELTAVPQDGHLAHNQDGKVRCGDNGIFCGCPVTEEQTELTTIAAALYEAFPHDGKYIIAYNGVIICQSHATDPEIEKALPTSRPALINPLGPWTGGPGVDAGATNRKLGSDMGDAVTGGGLHGKDLSKADVSVNILCHILAQSAGRPVTAYCAIGDEYVNGIPYASVVEIARDYIKKIGGFEKFAEWGLIRP